MMDADGEYGKGQTAGGKRNDDVELLSKDQELVFKKDDKEAPKETTDGVAND